jgi:hypothetical protein
MAVSSCSRDLEEALIHRIALGAAADVDAFVLRWLREAYDRNG